MIPKDLFSSLVPAGADRGYTPAPPQGRNCWTRA